MGSGVNRLALAEVQNGSGRKKKNMNDLEYCQKSPSKVQGKYPVKRK